MKKIIVIVLAMLTTKFDFAQTCPCEADLKYVINYFEENLPAYSVDVTAKNKVQYEIFKATLLKASRTNKDATNCYKTIVQYVEFFKDNHTGIGMGNKAIDLKDKQAVDSFIHASDFALFPTIELSEEDKIQHDVNTIHGIYQNLDSSYTVAIIPRKGVDKNILDGVVIATTNPLWKVGQIKFELFQKKGNQYHAFYYRSNHNAGYLTRVTFDKGIIYGMSGWIKMNVTNKHIYANEASENFDFHFLNDSTSYIRMPTLNEYKTAFIDSFYQSVDAKIKAKPYLIIDLRNNGGGSDGNGLYLWKYFFEKPIPRETKEYYVSKQLTKIWQAYDSMIHRDTINFDRSWRDEIDTIVIRLANSKPQTFIIIKDPADTFTTNRPDTFFNTAKKVILIANRNSASSTESMLYWATFSKKAIIVGENSGGYMGYGEVMSHFFTPNYNFEMYATTVRYKELTKYETNGIPPKYYLNNDSDWIEQSLQILQKESKK